MLIYTSRELILKINAHRIGGIDFGLEYLKFYQIIDAGQLRLHFHLLDQIIEDCSEIHV